MRIVRHAKLTNGVRGWGLGQQVQGSLVVFTTWHKHDYVSFTIVLILTGLILAQNSRNAVGQNIFFQQRVFTFNFMSPVSVWYWHLSMIWKIERDRVLPRVYNTNTSTLSNTYCFTIKHLILWRHTNTFLTSSTKGCNITRVTFLGEKEQKRTTSRNQLNENVNYTANFGMDSFWGQLRTVLVSWAAFPVTLCLLSGHRFKAFVCCRLSKGVEMEPWSISFRNKGYFDSLNIFSNSAASSADQSLGAIFALNSASFQIWLDSIWFSRRFIKRPTGSLTEILHWVR